MADEAETKDKATREVTIRNCSPGFRGLCLTADDNVTLDPGESATLTMTDLEIRDALISGSFEIDGKRDPGEWEDLPKPGTPLPPEESSETAAEDEIASAVAALDPGNDDHWTAGGLPSIKAVQALLPEGMTATRADIEAAAPDARRS